MSVREKAEKMNSGKGIEFMEGRTKGNIKDLLDTVVTVKDFAFLTSDDGKYVVFIIDGDEDNFYFGATVMTQNFLEFEAGEIEEIKECGLPILLYEKKNKKESRTYTAIEFYPLTPDTTEKKTK